MDQASVEGVHRREPALRHLTTDVLLEITNCWFKELDEPGKYIGVLQLDFSKAFDLINHNVLIEWVSDQCFKSQFTILQCYRYRNKVYQAQWLDLWTKSCLLLCMCWTRLALVRPAASLYNASPLNHHATGRQWCSNPDHYPDSEQASRCLNSFMLSAKQISRTSNFNVFCLTRPGIEPSTSRMPGERSTTDEL